MGLKTNAHWLHSIRQDKRIPTEKTPEEVSHDGERISLTFRQIGTFLISQETKIYGQGATAKNKEDARPVINGSVTESLKLVNAFGAENQHSDFDWDAEYGSGSDVLHFHTE